MTVIEKMIEKIKANRREELNLLIQKMNKKMEEKVPPLKEELTRLIEKSFEEGDVSYVSRLDTRVISVGHATEVEKDIILKHAKRACRRMSDKNFKLYAEFERAQSYWMDVIVEVDTRPLLIKFIDCVINAIEFIG